MKNIVCLISLSLLFLFGIKAVNTPSLLEEEVAYCILQENISADKIYPIPDQLFEAVSAFVDAESLTGQLRVVGRCQRQHSLAYSLLLKSVFFRMIKSHLDTLLQSANHVYTSLPRPCWSVSSEHYVFGMRRILI